MTALVALLVAALAVGRATRLITADSYPPAVWLRLRVRSWGAYTPTRHAWAEGIICPWCVAPYAALVDVGWALASGAPWQAPHGADVSPWAYAWWAVNLWAAVAYVASMVVVRDEPPAE